MKPIALHRHEARHLAAHGSVVIVRPMEPQPILIDVGNPPRWSYEANGLQATWVDGRNPSETGAAAVVGHGPLGFPGTKVWGQEEWRGWLAGDYPCIEYKAGDFPKPKWNEPGGVNPPGEGYDINHPCFDDWGWRSADEMPIWASRFPCLIHESTRICRANYIPYEDCIRAGCQSEVRYIGQSGYEWYSFDATRPSRPNPRWALGDQMARDHERFDYNEFPWVWVSVLRKETR